MPGPRGTAPSSCALRWRGSPLLSTCVNFFCQLTNSRPNTIGCRVRDAFRRGEDMSKYSPLTQLELDAIGFLEGFQVPSWNGPALPRPTGEEGLEDVIDTVGNLVARDQYLIQAKDGLSIEYTLRGITATAERFLFGAEDQVEGAAVLRALLTYVEAF